MILALKVARRGELTHGEPGRRSGLPLVDARVGGGIASVNVHPNNSA
jgi:hypothetical protein